MEPPLRALHNFPNFADLPTEIRLRVWELAAHCRPRTIQIGYDPENKCWQAWKDGCGGLPSIVHCCREARGQALKPYTRAFNAYIDLEEDTVFISDPLFSLRIPRQIFLSSECVPRIRKVAFSSDVYNGLADSFNQFPDLCEAPVTVLRKLGGLLHFVLALSEDGAGFEYFNSDDSDTDEEDIEDEDEEDEEEEDEEFGTEQEFSEEVARHITRADGSYTPPNDTEDQPGGEVETDDTSGEDGIVRQFLNRLETEAMATMSKGYYRHLGNIHFESAVSNPDHWESWATYLEELIASCAEEKEQFPDWVRPKISIMAVHYGLKRLGDYRTELHSLGDHSGGVMEGDVTGDSEGSEDSSESDSDH